MSLVLAMLFQETSAPSNPSSPAANAAAMGILIVYALIVVVMIAALWRVFTKAGEPGWAAIVPIYNVLVLLKIAGKPAWWLLLMLIPGVNLIVGIIMVIALARNFGKGTGYALGMIFLPPIFYPMLAWGDARYQPAA